MNDEQHEFYVKQIDGLIEKLGVDIWEFAECNDSCRSSMVRVMDSLSVARLRVFESKALHEELVKK